MKKKKLERVKVWGRVVFPVELQRIFPWEKGLKVRLVEYPLGEIRKELRLWFFRVGEPLVRTAAYERGTYECLDPNSFKTVRKVSRKYVFLDIWI